MNEFIGILENLLRLLKFQYHALFKIYNIYIYLYIHYYEPTQFTVQLDITHGYQGKYYSGPLRYESILFFELSLYFIKLLVLRSMNLI